MSAIRVPEELRPRIEAAATRHGYRSAKELVETLVRRGLKPHVAAGDTRPLGDQVAEASERLGYSSPEEMVLHLVEKGLRPLEEPADTAELERRLKGLGYIE